MRSTSLETYNEIKNNGLLSELRFTVYDLLFTHGAMTAQETWQIYRSKYNAISRDGITQRFSELERLKVIRISKKRSCSITGRKCLEWEVTGNLPSEPVRSLSSAEKIRRLTAAYQLLMRYADEEVKKQARSIIKGDKHELHN